jgi:hypothetical protein
MDTPTLTVTPTSFPTLIPFTAIPTQPLPNVVPSSLPYACAVVAKVPADSTIFKPNKDFDVKFWIRNVGTEPWAHGADLLYDGGTNMLTTNARYELPAVKPGQQVGPFIFDAKSPRKAGTFTMTFKVQGGFCYPYVRIIVRP